MLHLPKQEAAYNMGRAAHQLGLLHLAVPLYERALECVCFLHIGYMSAL